jgi:hypothetical protein
MLVEREEFVRLLGPLVLLALATIDLLDRNESALRRSKLGLDGERGPNAAEVACSEQLALLAVVPNVEPTLEVRSGCNATKNESKRSRQPEKPTWFEEQGQFAFDGVLRLATHDCQLPLSLSQRIPTQQHASARATLGVLPFALDRDGFGLARGQLFGTDEKLLPQASAAWDNLWVRVMEVERRFSTENRVQRFSDEAKMPGKSRQCLRGKRTHV